MSTATLDKDAEIQRLRKQLFDARAERDNAEIRAHNAGVMAKYYSDDVQRAQSLLAAESEKMDEQRLEIKFLRNEVIKKDEKIAILEVELDVKDAAIARNFEQINALKCEINELYAKTMHV
jgi:hypothetical protein